MSDSPSSSYADVQELLFSLKAGGVRFGIDRMQALVAALGHPERQVPVIHVAGTNGKGSTSAMIESIVRAAGWNVGLYTSPHLVRLGERVQVNRVPLTETEIMAYTAELLPVANQLAVEVPEDRASFFEFMTAMAFLQFARRRCDLAVVEVGMGGRLDATNVVQPEIAVITSIGLDHCEYLGDTVAKIAAEKAGIIKSGRPVVIGRVPAEAEEVIRRIAGERGAPVHSVREVFGDDAAAYPQSSLAGTYQRWNAATAVLATRLLPARWNVSERAIQKGLASVQWAGRWQSLRWAGRDLILDASHNEEGAAVLEPNLQAEIARRGRGPRVVVGVLGEARARPLLAVLAKFARALYLVVPEQARASSQAELRSWVPADFTGPVRDARVEDLFGDGGRGFDLEADDWVLVTGSIYLLGEVLVRLEADVSSLERRLQDF